MGARATLKGSATHGHANSTHRKHVESKHEKSPYRNLVLMGFLHLPLMYAVMFTMVDSANEVFHNLNTLYMAGMMVAPMVVLMPLFMKSMYLDKKLNAIVCASALALFGAFFLFLRNQTLIGDQQFLRSMIPHHSGAVLMCERANVSNPEIKGLCAKIIKSQSAEIEEMRTLLGKI